MNTESAYREIAKAILSETQGLTWTSVVLQIKFYEKMIRERLSIWNNSEVDHSRYLSSPASEGILGAAFFLRDDLLKTTGNRISGFTFTLHNDGKFNIDYQYAAIEE